MRRRLTIVCRIFLTLTILFGGFNLIAKPALAADTVLDNADSTSGWHSDYALSPDTTDKKEGTGSLSVAHNPGANIVEFYKTFSTAVNSGQSTSTGALQFWYYVSDVAQLTDSGQVEITSSGTYDTNEYDWNFSQIRPYLQNGWNLLTLRLSDANIEGGAPNLGAINYFRIYDQINAAITVKLDDIRFVILTQLDSGDSLTNWHSDNTLSLDTVDKKEGTGSLKSVGSNVTEFYRSFTTAINSNVTTSNGVLQFWYYVSDVTKLVDDGQVEISSSGTYDVNEYAFSFASLRTSLKNGWNFVNLYLSSAIPTGSPNLASINWFRIFDYTTASITTKVDDIRFVSADGVGGGSTGSASGDTLKYTVVNDSSGASNYYEYHTFSLAGYTFQTGDYIEYDVKQLNNITGAGGIDIRNSDGTYFRDISGWQDQNGISGHPGSNLSTRAYNTWYHRKLIVPASMVGKTSTSWDLVGENDTANLSYSTLYDNITVTDGGSTVKKALFQSSLDYDMNVFDTGVSPNHASGNFTISDPYGGAAPAKTALGSPNARVMSTTYATNDIVIASYKATDSPYNADSTGSNDATAAIQNALQDCYLNGGGVVFLPTGTYKISSRIMIPEHCTLRGDWQDPDAGTSYGTIIKANIGSSPNDFPGLFRLSGSSGLIGVTIYYPTQSASSPTTYPYAIEVPGWSYASNSGMNQTIKNVTLLNAYKGISINGSGPNGGETYYIENVKGTVLKQALQINNTSDVGRVMNAKFTNSYWANAPSGFNPQSAATLNSYTRTNGIGFTTTDLEFCEFYNMTFLDYNIGLVVNSGSRAQPSDTFTNLDIENSNIGVQVNAAEPDLGVKFANCTIKANQGTNPIAVQVNVGGNAPVLFNACTIGGGASKAIEVNSNAFVGVYNSTIDNWAGTYAITANNGTLVVEGNTFTPALTSVKKGISLSGSLVSAALLGNAISGTSSYFLDNSSSGDVKRQDTGYAFAVPGVAAHTFRSSLPKPPNTNLYDVSKAPYNADKTAAVDATSAIQSALNAASTVGGGTVYLPAGHYKISTHLTVPANVELRGSDEVSNKGDDKGTTLWAYEGESTSTPDTDTAFITLNGSNAGIKGLSIYYPNQPASTNSSTPFKAFPWSIRGNSSGVYAINVSFVDAYKGIDFGYGTNSTNNHYISGLTGTALRNLIAVGSSTEGWIENTQFNGTYWSRTTLPNQMDENQFFNYMFPYMRTNQVAYWLGNAQNEHLLNNFVYGTNKAYQTVYQSSSGPNAVGINTSADGTYSVYNIDSTGTTGVVILNGDASVNVSGPLMKISGGISKFFNIAGVQPSNPAIQISGGTSTLQGVFDNCGPAQITGGSTTWNGVAIVTSGNSAAQITISSGVTGNFSGNALKDSVNIVNNAGAGVTLSNNVKK